MCMCIVPIMLDGGACPAHGPQAPPSGTILTVRRITKGATTKEATRQISNCPAMGANPLPRAQQELAILIRRIHQREKQVMYGKVTEGYVLTPYAPMAAQGGKAAPATELPCR